MSSSSSSPPLTSSLPKTSTTTSTTIVTSTAMPTAPNLITNNVDPINSISMHDFLDFLKITCQVNESIINSTKQINTNGNRGTLSNTIITTSSSSSSSPPPTSTTTSTTFGMDKPIDYNELAKNELVNNLLMNRNQKLNNSDISPSSSSSSSAAAASTSLLNPNPNHSLSFDKIAFKKIRTSNRKSKDSMDHNRFTASLLDPALQEKLDEIINEGILDSVLPFLCPITASITHTSGIITPITVNAVGCGGGGGGGGTTQQSLNHNSTSKLITKKITSPKSSSLLAQSHILYSPVMTPKTIGDTITITNTITFDGPSTTGTDNSTTVTTPTTSQTTLTICSPLTSSKVTSSNNILVPLLLPKKSDDKHLLFTSRATSKERNPRRKSIQSNTSTGHNNNNESEVTIHVCDEIKNVARDFTISTKLLIKKMEYFADVTAGQRLEDMDISVHCDLQIFEFLIRWVKKDTMSQELWPILASTNVIPILVSASFLQMESLVMECLSYCHSNLNAIVNTSANFSCLNDKILSRLSAMFTNAELEMVKDKRDRVTPRLWTKLIISLCEPENQVLRGHYASAANLFRCIRCQKHLTQSVATYVHCQAQMIRINRWGQLVSQHVRDPSWNITNYVMQLYKELKLWRKVYWRLWGNCHYLYCITCETYFPVHQMNWCLYHPDQPQFIGPVTEGRMAGPTGRYPCCGHQAFRYETIPGSMGCQYREHTVHIEMDRDRAILNLAQLAAEGGCLYECAPTKQTISLNANNANEPWWNGIILAPHPERQGLLPELNLDIGNNGNFISGYNQKQYGQNNWSSDSDTSDNDTVKRNALYKQFSTSSGDGCESDDYSSGGAYADGGGSDGTPSPRKSKKRHRCPRRKVKTTGRFWSGELSARSNQDNQREFEEKAMKQIIAMVEKKTTAYFLNGPQHQYHQQNPQNQQQSNPPGGIYVRLESEWREQIKTKQNNMKYKYSK